MISGMHLDAGADAVGRGLEHRADLHGVDLGVGDAEAHAAVAEHRVHLAQRAGLAQDRFLARHDAVDQPRLGEVAQRGGQLAVGRHDARRLGQHLHAAGGTAQLVETRDVLLELPLGRQELVDRRVEQADGHRVRRHRLEYPGEVGALDRQQAIKRSAPLLRGVGDDHVDHDGQAVGRVEHALRAAQADALRAVADGAGRVVRRVGVGAHAEPRERVRPAEQLDQRRREIRLDRRHLAAEHAAVAAVDGDDVAFLDHLVADEGVAGGRRRRGCPRRRRRRACPCRAPPPPRARSCRRGW